MAHLTWKVYLKFQNLRPLSFQVSKHFIFCASWYILHRIAEFQSGFCSAMSCKRRWKHPLGWVSPYHLLHINSWRYSIRKLGFVLPLIFFNFSFAVDQLLCACCVCTPVTGSTKCIEWLTVLWFKPNCLCIWRYAAHWSVCKKPGCTWRYIMPKRVAAFVAYEL